MDELEETKLNNKIRVRDDLNIYKNNTINILPPLDYLKKQIFSIRFLKFFFKPFNIISR